MFTPTFVGKGHTGPIYAVTHYQNSVFTSSADRFVVQWSLDSGLQEGFTIRLDSAAYTLCTTPDLLIIGSSNGTITAVNIAEKIIVWEQNLFGNPWLSLSFDAVKNRLLAGDSSGNLLLLELKSGNKILHLPFACGKIRQIRLNDTGIFLATQNEGIIYLDAETCQELFRFNPHNDAVNALLLRNHVIYSVGKDGYLAISDWKNQTVLQRKPIHQGTIYGLVEVSEKIITASMDKTIKVWNLEVNSIQQRIDFKTSGHNRSVNGLVKISDQSLVSYSDDQSWILWEEKKSDFSWSEN